MHSNFKSSWKCRRDGKEQERLLLPMNSLSCMAAASHGSFSVFKWESEAL